MAELRFPVRDPSDELATDLGIVVSRAVADGQLAEIEAPIVREIGMRLILDGARTFEDALEQLEGLGAAGQRQWLDDARVACGMETIAEVERQRADAKFESAWQRLQPPGPERWSPQQTCHAPGCGAWPTGPAGNVIEVEVERWFCPRHRAGHEADMQPHEPAYVLNANAALVPSAKEAARLAKWHEERQAEEEGERLAREEHESREAAALAAVRQKYEREATISVAGVRVHPGGLSEARTHRRWSRVRTRSGWPNLESSPTRNARRSPSGRPRPGPSSRRGSSTTWRPAWVAGSTSSRRRSTFGSGYGRRGSGDSIRKDDRATTRWPVRLGVARPRHELDSELA